MGAHHFFCPTFSVGAQWVPFNTSPKIRGCLGTHGTHADYAPAATVEGQSPTIATLNSNFLKLAHLLFDTFQSLKYVANK